MTETRTVTTKLEFPYSRTLGAVVGGFAAGLRDQRLLASRTADGKVLMPPLEYDPETGDSVEDQLIEVGPQGTVRSWTWVAHPGHRHPVQVPFAFALIQVDGADTSMVHVVLAESSASVSTGMRVTPRWRDERTGRIDDIEGWEAVS